MTTTTTRRLIAAALLLLTLPATSAHAATGGAARTAVAHCHGRRATIVGTPGKDRLVGTQGVDVIVARGGPDLVQGRGGADVICGGRGFDTLRGGRGSDEIFGGVGDDEVFVDPGCTCRFGPAGTDDDHFSGGRGRDEVYSLGGRDRLDGGRGNDSILSSGVAPVRAHGGRGNDDILQALALVPGVVSDGGPGVDDVSLTSPHRRPGLVAGIAVDTVSATATLTDADGASGTARVTGFETYDVEGKLRHEIAVQFTDGDQASGLTVYYASLTASMGGGDDTVQGSDLHDVLDGGAGTDTVKHSPGSDACVNFEVGTC